MLATSHRIETADRTTKSQLNLGTHPDRYPDLGNSKGIL